MASSKIIFLDIDGVVLPNKAVFLPEQTKPIMKTFDPCAVSLLNRACHNRKYKIVIHSSWLRFWEPGFTLQHCMDQGIKKGHFHEDEPCCDGNIHWRYDRIDDWLSRHEDVKRYWILDDVAPEEGYPRTANWIPHNADEGITWDIYQKLSYEPFVK